MLVNCATKQPLCLGASYSLEILYENMLLLVCREGRSSCRWLSHYRWKEDQAFWYGGDFTHSADPTTISRLAQLYQQISLSMSLKSYNGLQNMKQLAITQAKRFSLQINIEAYITCTCIAKVRSSYSTNWGEP